MKDYYIKLLKDLEIVYERAMGNESFTAALRAKEMLGKLRGFFSKDPAQNTEGFSLAKMSEKDLEGLINTLEKKLAKMEE